MTWPIPALPTNWDNTSPQFDNHPAAHNALADAVNEIAARGGFVESAAYTPALGTISIGTGGSARNDAQFTFIGGSAVGSKGILSLSGLITFGTTGFTLPGAGNETIALPPGFNFAGKLTNTSPIGTARLGAAGSNFTGNLWWASATTMRIIAVNPATAGWVDPNATTPGTWAAGDQINWTMPGIEAVRV